MADLDITASPGCRRAVPLLQRMRAAVSRRARLNTMFTAFKPAAEPVAVLLTCGTTGEVCRGTGIVGTVDGRPILVTAAHNFDAACSAMVFTNIPRWPGHGASAVVTGVRTHPARAVNDGRFDLDVAVCDIEFGADEGDIVGYLPEIAVTDGCPVGDWLVRTWRPKGKSSMFGTIRVPADCCRWNGVVPVLPVGCVPGQSGSPWFDSSGTLASVSVAGADSHLIGCSPSALARCFTDDVNIRVLERGAYTVSYIRKGDSTSWEVTLNGS